MLLAGSETGEGPRGKEKKAGFLRRAFAEVDRRHLLQPADLYAVAVAGTWEGVGLDCGKVERNLATPLPRSVSIRYPLPFPRRSIEKKPWLERSYSSTTMPR